MSDVKVIGLMAGTYFLEDIGMEVPQGVTVTIPARDAHISKDLWRAISQRCIFQLKPGPSSPESSGASSAELELLREQVRLLTEANTRLQMRLAAQDPPQDSSQKLDAILALLHSSGPVALGAPVVRAHAPVPDGVVSGDVPTFIPSQIKPEGVDVQISTTPEESAGTGVTDAASALRRFRKTAGQ